MPSCECLCASCGCLSFESTPTLREFKSCNLGGQGFGDSATMERTVMLISGRESTRNVTRTKHDIFSYSHFPTTCLWNAKWRTTQQCPACLRTPFYLPHLVSSNSLIFKLTLFAFAQIAQSLEHWICFVNTVRILTVAQLYRIKLLTHVHYVRSKGFAFFQATAGGTGSGLGAHLWEKITERYPKKSRVLFTVFPSPNLATATVAPYNATFATHKLVDNSGTFFCIFRSVSELFYY